MSAVFRTYREFWPFYLEEHSKPATRGMHYIGSTLVFVVLFAALVMREWWLLLLVPLVGYGFAWWAHFRIEGNQPATFTYPVWSLFSDFRMYFLWLGGQLEPELRRYNVTARA
jgi:hypothetical protein